MLQPVLKRLRRTGPLTSEDERAVQAVFSRTVEIRRHGMVMREGEPPTIITALVEGMAFRCKLMPSGKRQITGIVVPGDICDLSSLFFSRLDHGIETAMDCEIAVANRQAVLDMIEARPSIARALWHATLTEEAVLREWVANVGQRTAHQRIAHLLCEVFLRNRWESKAGADVCILPLTQDQLADAAGLTPVSVNRVLQDLRAAGLISLRQKILTVHDWSRLCAAGEFDPAYLHQDDALESSTC